ncbi:MAG TPA: GNAT family N-acetyltransferase [Nitrososphaera sp.]|nr:GNAT family N-acetyltransferase [Nitrososphaera sp.]
MEIRQAKSSDRKEILSFCTNTFSWGDYIDQVWDYWFSDKNSDGRLFVAVDDDEGDGDRKKRKKIGMSHVAICSGSNKMAWLEGVRVHPEHRRSKVATELLETMLAYAGRRGARRASAIVSSENVPSQRMMEKNGFAVISRWVYYSTDQKFGRQTSEARLATLADLGRIWVYLQSSQIYRLSAGKYVKAWHWYPLDKKALKWLIQEKSVAITVGDNGIDGIVIINAKGYWRRTDVLQIVYLDSESKKALQHLIAFAANMYESKKYRHMHIVCYDSKIITSMLHSFKKEEDSELFLLYSKELFMP